MTIYEFSIIFGKLQPYADSNVGIRIQGRLVLWRDFNPERHANPRQDFSS